MDQTFYRYTDDQGRLHVVDSPSAVPNRYRDHAQRLEMKGRAETSVGSVDSSAPQGAHAPSVVQPSFHAPSFALGFIAAAMLALVFFAVRGNAKRGAMIVVGAVLAASLVIAYFGLIRRATGTGAQPFSSPTALVEDARKNVDALNEQQRKQEKAIDDVMKER